MHTHTHTHNISISRVTFEINKAITVSIADWSIMYLDTLFLMQSAILSLLSTTKCRKPVRMTFDRSQSEKHGHDREESKLKLHVSEQCIHVDI